TAVDAVVANYTLDGSRASINVRTVFTAASSGKSMEITETGVRTTGSAIDNGDGTYSVSFKNAGQSPGFKLPTGEVIHDTGIVGGVATFDATTGDFLSFEVVKVAGPRPDACSAIIAALICAREQGGRAHSRSPCLRSGGESPAARPSEAETSKAKVSPWVSSSRSSAGPPSETPNGSRTSRDGSHPPPRRAPMSAPS